MHLHHVGRRVNGIGHHHHRATAAGVGVDRHLGRSEDVGRTVPRGVGHELHRAENNNRNVGRQHAVEHERGFLNGIRAVRDDDPVDGAVVGGGANASRQRQHALGMHVRARVASEIVDDDVGYLVEPRRAIENFFAGQRRHRHATFRIERAGNRTAGEYGKDGRQVVARGQSVSPRRTAACCCGICRRCR